MSRTNLALFNVINCVFLFLVIPGGLWAQSGDGGALEGEELSWPRVHQEEGMTISVYQPQIEKWEGDNIESRMAVGVQAMGEKSPVYGVIWMSAKAEIDKAARIVTMQNFKITKIKFPTQPSEEGEYLKRISQYLPHGIRTVALDHLEASFAISRAVKSARGVKVKNDPPRIIFSTTPAFLILVDGKPVLRPVEGQEAERVINTKALILKFRSNYYVQAMGHWYQSTDLRGPWAVAVSVPVSMELIKQSLVEVKEVDLMEPTLDGSPPETAPTLYVSTEPAEVIQTEGAPEFLPIEGTEILQVKNSDDIIFMDVKTNEYYVLISGRWFKAKSLEGPWGYVSGKALPLDFAKIPVDHPRANALVSVPGTAQAQEAVIANSIPQTSTIKRSEAKLEVSYDGETKFAPIEGTPLQYAVNSPVPVIRVSGESYYSVENGVWFVASSPTGPWEVATSVPAVIYTIPPSSPLYYVTYVRVYGSTPEYVYDGYTPGYLGTVVSPDDVVVYGTGYYYPPYIGDDWIGWPWTYGFGAEIAWGPYGGFAFGFAAGAVWGAWGHPWWGPLGWGWHHGWRYTQVSMNHVNIYNHWGSEVAIANHSYRPNEYRDGHWSQPTGRIFNPYSGRRTMGDRSWDNNIKRGQPGARVEQPTVGRNNLYGGRNGQVYRYNESRTWERNTPRGWKPTEGSSGFRTQSQELNRERSSRELGHQMFNNSRSVGGFRSGGGSGAHGGGRH